MRIKTTPASTANVVCGEIRLSFVLDSGCSIMAHYANEVWKCIVEPRNGILFAEEREIDQHARALVKIFLNCPKLSGDRFSPLITM